MDKFIIALRPCPWCKKTPNVSMYFDDGMHPEGTWQWYIYCLNTTCHMKPKSPHVSIRKTTKNNSDRLKEKIQKMCNYWNEGNDYIAYEGKLIDLNEVINREK